MINSHIRLVNNRVEILDQTRLPEKKVIRRIRTYRQMARAIRELAVRGAPALGIAGAYGLYIGLCRLPATLSTKELHRRINSIAGELAATRPTAVNLQWAINRCLLAARACKNLKKASTCVRNTARAIHREDAEMCRNIGRSGAGLVPKRALIMTHCNTGSLATGGTGTALAVVYAAKKAGKKIGVLADETRPLLQGARLTAWELRRARIPVTVICDSMAGAVMRDKRPDCVIVGADRIALNGDTANKIGTYGLAVLAKAHRIPFYVAAPSSTIDRSIKSGREIPVETRNRSEITRLFGRMTVPDRVPVYNPAFDITPYKYISAIITEKGVRRPPFRGKL
jgi:methylthioribose-1-phosphate isomerase